MSNLDTDDTESVQRRRPRVLFFTVLAVLVLIGVVIEIMVLQTVAVWPEPGTPAPGGSDSGGLFWLRFAAG